MELNLDLKGIKMIHETKEKFIFPPGEYYFGIDYIDKKPTKNGTGSYLLIKFTSLKGETEGKNLWHQINIENANPKAQNIGLSELKTLAYMAQDLGYENIKSTDQLIGKTVAMTLDTQVDMQYGEKNIVKEYKRIDTTTSIADDVPF